jgi:alpha-glucosidase (family GH31 glycosyl hydrolase)
MVEDVIQKYKSSGFPLDVIYLDIPYLKDFTDFTVDTDKFKDMYSLTQMLHNNSQYLVLI